MRHSFTARRAVALGILAAAAAAPAALAANGTAKDTPPTSGASIPMATLIAKAKKEGVLNTIALPPTWANYGEIMKAFSKKYGIKIVNANPNGSSAEELQAVTSLKGQGRAPDVVDVGPAFAIQGAQQGLFAPYKVSTWASIPSNMKDANGAWYGDYWGVIAFGSNAKLVPAAPTSWSDLQNPQFKGQVALNGDPRTAGAAMAGVFSASLANAGSLNDIMPGIDYFAHLKTVGNYIPVDATPATIASGQTPITVDWDYLQASYALEAAKSGIKWNVSIPKTGVYGAFYAQAISATAPHPYAARLWEEFLYSDQGQLLFLKGFTHPARFQDLSNRKAIPASLLAALPSPAAYKNVQFATDAQQTAAKTTLTNQWGPKVAGS